MCQCFQLLLTLWMLYLYTGWIKLSPIFRHTNSFRGISCAKYIQNLLWSCPPRQSQKRSGQLGGCATSYHKNTLKNILARLNRHFSDIGRQIDVIHGPDFKSVNLALDGYMKEKITIAKLHNFPFNCPKGTHHVTTFLSYSFIAVIIS